MPFNSIFSWAMKKRVHQIELFKKYPLEVQKEVLMNLLSTASRTELGENYKYDSIASVADFKGRVPLYKYPDLKPYIDRMLSGEQNLLWPSEVNWFAKSSGTSTGKSKHIPITTECLVDCHYKGGKDLLALYYDSHPDRKLYKGKHLIIGGSSELVRQNATAHTGDLSSIIIENLPMWAELRRTPKKKIALLANWEEKLAQMAATTIHDDVYILAGVPSWTLKFLERVLEITGAKNILEVWPNLELYMHGGVNFSPYRRQFEMLMPSPEMNFVETYNASEGFFGIQDRPDASDMLLMLDYGIFYEFIPNSGCSDDEPNVLDLEDVETNVDYEMVITTNTGLWRYRIGDVVRFTEVDPFRFVVVGRTQHFINCFGEELMVWNVEEAVKIACAKLGCTVNDYTVAPVYASLGKSGGHEWVIEFGRNPEDVREFGRVLDAALQELNSDYEAKRSTAVMMDYPIIQVVNSGTFYAWLAAQDKLGGQHKVPRLQNDRKLIEEIVLFATDNNWVIG